MARPLTAYLAQDRLRAVARGETLPDLATDSALFAEISGFTPLTEQLTQTLGACRGIEELTRRINRLYDALINVVKQYGGSVHCAPRRGGESSPVGRRHRSPARGDGGGAGTERARGFERTQATAQAALCEEAFNAAFETGQKMTLEEAIQLALA